MKIENLSPNVFIIIVNYNSWRDTIECLSSLKKITYKNFELLIIDNHSTDNSYRKIKEYLKKNLGFHVSSFKLHENLGFAGANNIGINHALKKGADYMLLLNPDTIVEPDFLTKLIEVAENWKKQKKLAFLGPRILLYNGPISFHDREKRWNTLDGESHTRKVKIYSNGGLINWSQTKGILKDYGRPVSAVQETKPFETDYISGTCLLVSREIIEKVGQMREEYFLYYEDTDWAIRARKEGIASVVVPESVIWHKMSTSTKEGSPSYIYYHVRNGLYCGWLNGSILQKITVLGLSKWIFVKQPLKFLIPALTSEASVLQRQSRKWARPVMRGVVDFWRNKMGKLTSTYTNENR